METTEERVALLAVRLVDLQEESYRARVLIGALEYLLVHATNNPGELARIAKEWAEDQNGRMLDRPIEERFLAGGEEELAQLVNRLERAAGAQVRASTQATATPSA